MLLRLREQIALVLLLLLPFHAFIVTFSTKLLLGNFKDVPLGLSIWKELVLLLLLVITGIEFCIQSINQKTRKPWVKFDVIDYVIIAFTVLALVVSFATEVTTKQLALGIKYDIWPLALFFVFRRVQWSTWLTSRVLNYLPVLGVVIVGIGVLFMLLPAAILEWLGYSEAHSLYMAHKPIAAFQQLGGSTIRRMQSVLSGPNQAGIWLLISLSIGWANILRTLPTVWTTGSLQSWVKQFWPAILLLSIIMLGIVVSFSRSAWLASISICALGIHLYIPGIYKRYIFGSVAITTIIAGVTVAMLLPQVFVRTLSNNDHIIKPLEAIYTVKENPLGLGLGVAGPASNHTSDSCVTVEDANIAWAEPYPELCVFLNKTQLQPSNYACNCPFITENWLLQIAVETGVLGAIFYICVLVLVGMQLYKIRTVISESLLYMLVGISVAGIFLHSWEDSAIAYTFWLVVAMVVPVRIKRL